MEKHELKALLDRYNSGTANEKEQAVVESWYNGFPPEFNAPHHEQILESKEATWEAVASRTEPVRKRLWPRVAVAAAAVAVITFGTWIYVNEITSSPNASRDEALVMNDIAPGTVGATLTLANGKKISLSDTTRGELAKEAGVTIRKTKEGILLYEIAESQSASRNDGEVNTLSTAKGETYQVRLPDGSSVYLNAASRLTYTVRLLEKGQRRVKLEGEGYFEISKDKKHPFVVQTDKQEVEVLGTHFNINSYQNEPVVTTTLIEGAVKVTSDHDKQLLKPGQMALNNGAAIQVIQANVGEVTAWKNGDFEFNEEKMSSIIKKLERWYNVEIELSDKLAGDEFTGKIARNRNISSVLRMMEKTNSIYFKIEGRRIKAIEK